METEEHERRDQARRNSSSSSSSDKKEKRRRELVERKPVYIHRLKALVKRGGSRLEWKGKNNIKTKRLVCSN